MVELIHQVQISDLIHVLYLQLIIFLCEAASLLSARVRMATSRIVRPSKIIKSFRCAHEDRVCVCVFTGVSDRSCI